MWDFRVAVLLLLDHPIHVILPKYVSIFCCFMQPIFNVPLSRFGF